MITRSTGIDPGYLIPVPCFPGGGYEGVTQELDDSVQRAAEDIQNRFNCDVEIRFNSDRKSGGAFIKNPSYDDAGFGISCGIYENQIFTKWLIRQPLLRDRSLATDGQPWSAYLHGYRPGVYTSDVLDMVAELVYTDRLLEPRPQGTHIIQVKLAGKSRWAGVLDRRDIGPSSRATAYEEDVAPAVLQHMRDKSPQHEFRIIPKSR